MALKLTNRDYITRLTEVESFRSQLNQEALSEFTRIITNPAGDSVAKKASLELLLAYPIADIERFARDPTFVSAAMKVDPQATVLFIFCRIEPTHIWENLNLLEPAGTTESVHRLILELAQTYRKQFPEIAWLPKALVASLNSRGSIEIPLRVVQYLSGEIDLTSHKSLVERLLHLLSSGECSVTERTLLFRSFLELTHTSLVAHYAHFLQAAESLLEYAPNALRILGRQNLPAPSTRYAARLLAVVHTFLDGNDPYGHLAAFEIMIKMSRRHAYVAHLCSLESKIHPIAIQTQNLDVFSGVLPLVQGLRLRPSFDVHAIGSKLIEHGQNEELVASVRRQMDEIEQT
jgi:hypothetical protein